MLTCVFNGSSGCFSCATFLTGKSHGCTPKKASFPYYPFCLRYAVVGHMVSGRNVSFLGTSLQLFSHSAYLGQFFQLLG